VPPTRAPGLAAQLRSGDARALLTRHADLALAALVIAIVGMMIVPLPAFLLDLLISLNIAVAVTLLLIAIYVTDALKIATFPSLLLLTTLFRLALEVSATRLILLKANAGAVIHAFGGFVVAGNLVVGAVIFLILTLIQFIVIAKGSERVAEVAARFTLDAMPGKQMSIDAELRAGHIDAAEARRRRTTLARESQLFGSMDGAMKFVKGDAVAGIVVLAVNIVGGLIIGVLQRGMDAGTAVRTYTLLTIGEGLVAQIPALVISTAAGIVVTRVASEEEGAHLGRAIGAEVLAHPKALAVAAALLALLGLVPGLPAVPFVILAALAGVLAWRLLATDARPDSPVAMAAAHKAATALATATAVEESRLAAALPHPAPRLSPVTLELSAELTMRMGIVADGGARFNAEHVAAARAQLFHDTGLSLPALRIVAAAPDLPGRRYRLSLNEIPAVRGEISEGTSGDAGATSKALLDDLLRLMRRRGHELLGIEETQALLDALEPSHPALVREVVPKRFSPALLAEVLRRLAAEGISLRHLPEILEALATADGDPRTCGQPGDGGASAGTPAPRDPAALTERVRAALARALTHAHVDDQGVVRAIALDPLIEDTLREALRTTANGGRHLALEPQLARDIRAGVVRALAAVPARHAGPGPVIVTAGDLRRHVRGLLQLEHPALAVLAFGELAPEITIDTVARVSP
jgi:type III secretion protein V